MALSGIFREDERALYAKPSGANGRVLCLPISIGLANYTILIPEGLQSTKICAFEILPILVPRFVEYLEVFYTQVRHARLKSSSKKAFLKRY